MLDEECVAPTTRYGAAEPASTVAVVEVTFALMERGVKHPRTIHEQPEKFQFQSANFDLLSAILDQISKQDRDSLFDLVRCRISNGLSYRHKYQDVLGAGAYARCTSELPLVAEFLVRRGEKKLFIRDLTAAAPTPGLTLLLMQLEEMIALNFTLFTAEEYSELPVAIFAIKKIISDLQKRPRPMSTIESNTLHHVCREVPELCDSILEACRKAKYLYVKGSLLPGMNLEVNQDKGAVRTFLEKLGFTALLIQSLDEAERLYRAAVTPFELKSSMGHLRSFLEQLHLQACTFLHGRFGGNLPTRWGGAHQYLRDHDVLTDKEQQFAIHFYALMSDTSVHPLVAEREYARLMRNMSIEYGLLLLTKLDRLGLRGSKAV